MLGNAERDGLRIFKYQDSSDCPSILMASRTHCVVFLPCIVMGEPRDTTIRFTFFDVTGSEEELRQDRVRKYAGVLVSTRLNANQKQVRSTRQPELFATTSPVKCKCIPGPMVSQ